jgi:hypothetical protein
MQLTNLNEMQKALCEILWELDDSKEVANFLDGLPVRIRQDAHNMIELMILNKIDETEATDIADDIVNKILAKKKDTE